MSSQYNLRSKRAADTAADTSSEHVEAITNSTPVKQSRAKKPRQRSPLSDKISNLRSKKKNENDDRDEQMNDNASRSPHLAAEVRAQCPSNGDESVEVILADASARNLPRLRARKASAMNGIVRSTVLVYPFPNHLPNHDERMVESCADGLFDGIEFISLPRNAPTAAIMDESSSDSRRASGSVTILEGDYNRLCVPDEYLSDSNIDFWLKWITRRLPKGSRVCTMSSLFYTKLGEKDGVEKAASWVKNVDFFGMDMIFVPVTMGLHHTISVIVNPGSIANAYKRTGERLESDSRPAILFMDALDAHDFVSISRNLNNFLNHLWVKGGRSNVAGSARPFTRTANPVIIPFVPKQPNQHDCGVYVCKYCSSLLILYQRLGGVISTYGVDVGRLISECPEFRFGQSQIVTLRADMRLLVERLSSRYHQLKSLVQRTEEEMSIEMHSRSASSLPSSSNDDEIFEISPRHNKASLLRPPHNKGRNDSILRIPGKSDPNARDLSLSVRWKDESTPATLPGKTDPNTRVSVAGTEAIETTIAAPKVTRIAGMQKLQKPAICRFRVVMEGITGEQWKTMQQLRELDEEMLLDFLLNKKKGKIPKTDEFDWVRERQQNARKVKKYVTKIGADGSRFMSPPGSSKEYEIGLGGFPKATPGREAKDVFTGKQLDKVQGLKSSPYAGHDSAEEEKAKARYRQWVGELADRVSHMKGRNAERQRESWYNSHSKYRRSVTPAEVDYKGRSTKYWSRIHAFNIVVDPYVPSNPAGGRYHGRTRPYQVIITAGDGVEEARFKDIMKAYVDSNFEDTDLFQFIFVPDTKSAVAASKGEYCWRERVKPGPVTWTAGGGLSPIPLAFEGDEAVDLGEYGLLS